MALDFSLLGQGPQFGNVLQAFQMGQDARKQRETQNALALYTQDPEAGIKAATPVDPILAMKLQSDYAGKKKEAQRQAVFQETDPTKRMSAAMGTADPETIRVVQGLDDTQREKVKQTTEALGSFAFGLRTKVPPEQRKAVIQQHAADLKALGFDDQKIASFDPTDQNLDTMISQAQTLDKLVAQHEAEQKANQEAKKPVVVSGHLVDPTTGKSIYDAPEPRKYMAAPAGTNIYEMGGDQSPATGGAQGQGRATGRFEDFYANSLAPAEGGYTPSDGNGAPANFGINQKANPDVDVRSLTPDQAKQIALERYWKPSGADKLPPGLAEIQADTAFNMGVDTAQKLLQQSGGDPQKYLQLRDARYRSIAANDPSKRDRLPGWLKRNADLAAYVGASGANPQQAGGPRLVASGGPKPTPPQARPATAEEKARYGIPANIPAQIDPNGKIDVVSVPIGPNKVPTEDQAKTGFNAERMKGASQTLTKLEGSGYDPSLSAVGAALARPDSREYDSAKKEWSDGLIRLTTGAAATKQELEQVDKAYFPQIGDGPRVVQYKAQRRQAAEQAALVRANGLRQGATGQTAAPASGAPKVIRYDAQGNRIK